MSEEIKKQNQYVTWEQTYILWFTLMIILLTSEYYISKNSSDVYRYILTGVLLGICLPVIHQFVKRTYRFGKQSKCSLLHIVIGVLFSEDKEEIEDSRKKFEVGTKQVFRTQGNCKNIKIMIENRKFYLETAIDIYNENTKKINDIMITTGLIIAGILCIIFSETLNHDQTFFILVSLIFAVSSILIGCLANYRSISTPYTTELPDLTKSKFEEKELLTDHCIEILNLTEIHHYHTSLKIALKNGQLWLFFASLLIFILVVIWYALNIIM